MPIINIIGAGRLGKTIGRLISVNQIGTIQGICNKSFKSSLAACKYIGEGEPFMRITDLPPSDITFITTPDENIKSSARELAKSYNIKEFSTVVHCSGALTSSELESLKAKNCNIVSVHPMHSFASPDISITHFNGTYCAIEGDVEAKTIMERIFSAIGGIPYSILSDKKAKYHASGVIASNYLVTVCNQAHICLLGSGVESELAMKIITNLMKGTIDNLSATLSVEKSLTGPVKRGDLETISSHLSAIQDDEKLDQFYRIMGGLTVDVAKHDPNKTNALLELFNTKEHQNETPTFFKNE